MPKLEHHWSQQRWRDFKCKCCGVAFKSSRIDAEFCGPTCRQRDRRIRLAAAQAADVAPKLHNIEVPICAHELLKTVARIKAKSPPRSSPSAKVKPKRTGCRFAHQKKGGKKK